MLSVLQNKFTCPSCAIQTELQLSLPVYLCCHGCGTTFHVDKDKTTSETKLQKRKLQPVRNIVIGTTGSYQGKSFHIVGRIRSVRVGSVSNEWMMLFADGTEMWLSESGFSYFIYESKAVVLPIELIKAKKAGSTLTIEDRVYYICDVSRQTEFRMEGQIPENSFDDSSYFTYELTNVKGSELGTICIFDKETVEFYKSVPVELESLNLNITPPGPLQATACECQACNRSFNTYLGAQAYSSICPHCGSLHNSYNGILERTNDKVKVTTSALDIPIGTKGQLNGVEYYVVGYACKKESGTSYHWHEYTLISPLKGLAYLSQYDGHWIFLREVNAFPLPAGRAAHLDSKTYDLFSKYKSKVVNAAGEFIYRFSAGETMWVQEYISPPEMISRESDGDNIVWLSGEYMQPADIKKAFLLKNIPPRKGIGMIQPFAGKFSSESLRRLVIFLAALWVISQVYFIRTAKEELAFMHVFGINDSLNRKEIYSNSFDLKYGTCNAEIKISTNIDNNWMYTAVTLVNEGTGDLYDLDLEAEYYHGYEGGESWAEGSSWVSQVVSQVPEGKYYMIIHPEKPTNMPVVNLNISVQRDVYVFSNGFIALLLLAIFPVFYFYRKRSFEAKRWYNSNYSPYDE